MSLASGRRSRTFSTWSRALIDEATYMEQLERLADYLNDAMLLAMKNYDFDLLMGYQVQTDEAGHEFTLVDPRQQRFRRTRPNANVTRNISSAHIRSPTAILKRLSMPPILGRQT